MLILFGVFVSSLVLSIIAITLINKFKSKKKELEATAWPIIDTSPWPKDYPLRVDTSKITTSGWYSSDEAFMAECWYRTHDKAKCELCEYRFKCYTNKAGPLGPSGRVGPSGVVGNLGVSGPGGFPGGFSGHIITSGCYTGYSYIV